MKKQQKIIELRTAAKLKVAEIETQIYVARSEADGERARLTYERACELKGLEAGSTERLDTLAKYRALLADANEKLTSRVAQHKLEIQFVKSECEKQCAAAEDDPEPETHNEQPQQETVYCDGSEYSARIVARRLINKMPHIPEGGYLFVHIISDDHDEYFVNISAMGEKQEDYVSTIFSRFDGEKDEAKFVQSAREIFKTDDGKGETKVACPKSSALNAAIGCDPVGLVEKLISDTIGKEGGDE